MGKRGANRNTWRIDVGGGGEGGTRSVSKLKGNVCVASSPGHLSAELSHSPDSLLREYRGQGWGYNTPTRMPFKPPPPLFPSFQMVAAFSTRDNLNLAPSPPLLYPPSPSPSHPHLLYPPNPPLLTPIFYTPPSPQLNPRRFVYGQYLCTLSATFLSESVSN